jgi:hypothetical protein
MARSLAVALSDVPHPSYMSCNLASAYWKLLTLAHLVMDTIPINYAKDYCGSICTTMISLDLRIAQYFWSEFPLVGLISLRMDVVSCDCKIRVRCIWCPCVEGDRNLAQNILTSKWIGNVAQNHAIPWILPLCTLLPPQFWACSPPVTWYGVEYQTPRFGGIGTRESFEKGPYQQW